MTERKPARRRRRARKRGRPSYVPDDKTSGQVDALATFGYGVEKIAAFLELAPNTVRKHYGSIIKKARPKLMGAAVSGLAKGLAKGEGWAVKYVLSCHGREEGWVERHEIGGPDGGAIPVRLSSLNDNQLAQLLARLELATQAAQPG